MNRRDLFYRATAFLGILALEEASSGINFIFKACAINLGHKKVQLQPNTSYLAESNALFLLPKNPRDGDFVQIIVDQTSLPKPCVLKDMNAKIINDDEPLILDTMAIVKLTYESKTKNWKHV